MTNPRTTANVLGLALALGLAASAVAHDGPSTSGPGSLLVFPYFDSTDAASTVITVTNTNTDRTVCPSGERRAGDIVIHYMYFSRWGVEFDRYETLSPGDTISVVSDLHNPEIEQGYLFVTAEDFDDQLFSPLVDFDALIGSAVVADANVGAVWRYQAFGFRGVLDSFDACERVVVDQDGDGTADFDGFEYERFPRELLLDSFFEETGPFRNRLTLLTTGSSNLMAEVELQLYNNQGDLVLGTFQMFQQFSDSLTAILPSAADLQGDTRELGRPPLETGWAVIKGLRLIDGAGNPYVDVFGDPAIPPLLGVFAQWLSNRGVSHGDSLHVRGNLDGLEIPGGDNDRQINP